MQTLVIFLSNVKMLLTQHEGFILNSNILMHMLVFACC